MVGKLLKHEFRATGRIMLLIYAAVTAAAVLANFSIRLMDVTDNTFLHILFGLVIALFLIGIAAAVVITAVVMIVRFYHSLLKDQGYLMHTLPVTVHGHIWSKLIVSLVWFAATFALIGLLVMATALIQSGTRLGELFAELPLREIIQDLREYGLWGNVVVLGLEGIVSAILACLILCLHCYTAMSLGQMFSKNQILMCIVFFIAVNFAFSILDTCTGAVFIRHLEVFDPVGPGATMAFAQAMGGLAILGQLIHGAILYAATFLPLKYRLNLA